MNLKSWESKKSGFEFSVFGHLNTILANSARIKTPVPSHEIENPASRMVRLKDFVKENGRMSAGIGIGLRVSVVQAEVVCNFLTLGQDGDVRSPYEFRISNE